jgi:hypothetical protein
VRRYQSQPAAGQRRSQNPRGRTMAGTTRLPGSPTTHGVSRNWQRMGLAATARSFSNRAPRSPTSGRTSRGLSANRTRDPRVVGGAESQPFFWRGGRTVTSRTPFGPRKRRK